MKPRTPLPKLSKKKQAHLAASGVRVFSTITPKPKAKGAMMQRRSPVPKANPERQKKAAKRGAAKHRAYMASETRKVVDARANGRCEVRTILRITERGEYPMVNADGVALPGDTVWLRIGDRAPRCETSDDLQHHHKTYARYGGNELPEDIVVACKPHHAYLESLKPAGNRFTRRGLPQT